MDKRLKLGVLGIVAFAVVFLLVTWFFPAKAPAAAPADKASYFDIEPYFVTQFWEANPNYKPPAGYEIDSSLLEEKDGKVQFAHFEKPLALSEQGFPQSELQVGNIAALKLSNGSSKMKNFRVISPALDGTEYNISEFSVTSGGEAVLTIRVPSYIEDIIAKGKVKLEQTDKGLLVFAVSCTSGCSEGSNLLRIYYTKPA
ncbi:MAG: hypothetical protein NT067_01610 [Candidatus Diapherotrites archaeon]|nr:hypothetical protein [Candidatus Diapherotrites archaeon]